MHISRLIVKNYRNLSYVDVRLNSGLNVIVGDNGSGKTNLVNAIRLLLDSSLSPTARRLTPEDFLNTSGGPTTATDILVAAEFEYDKGILEESNFANSLLQSGSPVPRLVYRFRPNPTVIFEIENEGRDANSLSIKDYQYERVPGLDVDFEKLDVKEPLGLGVRESLLQNYQIVDLPALRDVEASLRVQRISPLAKLLELLDVPEESEAEIIAALLSANKIVSDTPSFQSLASAITESYKTLIGDLNPLIVSLGFSEPSISQVMRALNLMVTDAAIGPYGLDRNGLGFNNLLFAAMQIELFRKRVERKGGGQLLLIEEPEAHLHPHAQQAFLETLRGQTFQTIVTTHSPHITSRAGIKTLISFSRTEGPAKVCNLSEAAHLEDNEARDLDRYLDATRSDLLFARRVLLVEGSAELQLASAFADSLGIQLLQRGISIIAINGTHFSSFAKLFSTNALAIKCAIITDGDNFRDSEGRVSLFYDDGTTLSESENGNVKTLKNRTTLEFAICQPANLEKIRTVARTLGVTHGIRTFDRAIKNPIPTELARAQLQTYRIAVRFGKARFAQLLARESPMPPDYFSQALAWLNA